MATIEELLRTGEVQMPSWVLENALQQQGIELGVDHAGLGDLEWLADFQGGTGPNILVADQEAFTNPAEFARVIGPNKDASVEDKIALYLETGSPKGLYSSGKRWDKGPGWSWKYEDLPYLEDSLFGEDRGLVDYDDDREDDETSPQLWAASDRAMAGTDIHGGVSYLHPAKLHDNIKNQQTIWQHEALHGVIEEIKNKADLDPWFKNLLENEEVGVESGVPYNFEEMVARLVDAKRNGDVAGLAAIMTLPKNTRTLFDEYRSGEKDAEEIRNALKTTLSYFMVEEMVTQASNNEYMGQAYLDEISEISSNFSKSLDDAPLDQLFDMALDVLAAQNVDSWLPEESDVKGSQAWHVVKFWNDSMNEFREVLIPEEPLTIEIDRPLHWDNQQFP